MKVIKNYIDDKTLLQIREITDGNYSVVKIKEGEVSEFQKIDDLEFALKVYDCWFYGEDLKDETL